MSPSTSGRWEANKPKVWRLCVIGAFVAASLGDVSAADPQGATPAHLAPLSPQTVPKVASYTLRAQLDPKTHEVRGKGTIRFRNPSRKPTRSLYFHLYLNAFESDETLFLRAKASRSGQRRGERGKITVHSLSSPALGGKNLWPENAHTPNDEKDRTDIRVQLPRALEGHEEIELEVEFTSKLPQVVERTGWERDFFLIAQWFPKLAKREPDGKWAHFPFHPNGEFYADFGDYAVTLDVPEEYVVGSTGMLEELESEEPGFRRYHAEAQGVHDFVWTAWPEFQSETRNLHGVQTRLLSPPDTPRVREKTWETLERGLGYLGRAYGPYPHPALTVVHPPTYAARAGGMEYPQLITTGGSETSSYLGIRNVELLTIHELAHQWFQGLLASNEMAHPFLDEGLTTYAESRYLEDTYGHGSLLSLFGLQVSRTAGSRYVNLRHPGTHAIASSAPEFDSFHSIGSLVYARSALCLETLRRVYGEEKIEEVFSLYTSRYRFRHPRPQDFFDVFSEVYDPEVQTQVELMFERRGDIDLAVLSVETQSGPGSSHSQILVEKTGKLSLPTHLKLHYIDGTSDTVPLPTLHGRRTVDVQHEIPIRMAELDPEHRILLDRNLENNRRAPNGRHPDRDQQFHSALALASWALGWLSP